MDRAVYIRLVRQDKPKAKLTPNQRLQKEMVIARAAEGSRLERRVVGIVQRHDEAFRATYISVTSCAAQTHTSTRTEIATVADSSATVCVMPVRERQWSPNDRGQSKGCKRLYVSDVAMTKTWSEIRLNAKQNANPESSEKVR